MTEKGVVRRHPVWSISVVTAVALVAATVALTVAYDHRAAKTLPAGATVGGVAIGGMSEARAVAVVRAAIEDPLHRTTHVATDGFEADTTPWDLGLRVDVPAAVHTAMTRSHSGSLPGRVWRRLFGHPSATVAVTPTWGKGDLPALIERAAKSVDTEPQDAKVDASSGFVNIVAPKVGRRLDAEKARAAVLDGARSGSSSIKLVADPVEPKVGAAAVSKVILVRTGENMLYLYENGKVTKQWPVATGAAAFPTPTGTWKIVSKLVNPTWTNPRSAWSAGMPATIGPGPNNPLGTRALALDASGILIHATSDTGSIGYSASHGCIRMNPADEMDLFGRVESGTVVAIVKAGPPKDRNATPPPATPDQTAATNF